MGIVYPPAPPTFSGDIESINRFLATPTLVQRRFMTLMDQRFISDVLLTGRTDVSGGSITYEVNEQLYTDRTPEIISPGGEYPLSGVPFGTPQVVKVDKWGMDVLVTDEKIKRSNFSAVETGFSRLVNTMVKTVDGICLSLIASTVTATSAASATWSSATPKILYDVMKAKATVRALNHGYDPDILVVDDLTWALLASDPNVAGARAREDHANPVYTGTFLTLAGLSILPTPNLPAAGAWVIDSKFLGGIADENLGGGYAGGIVETKSIRDDDNDQWRLRARRVMAPYVTDPGAAIKITGI